MISMRLVALLSFVTMVTLVSCSGHDSGNKKDSTSPIISYELPAGIHWSEHWFTTPAVDLMSADGTFIRAYSEADYVRIHNSNGGSGSYPGFSMANRTGQVSSAPGDDEYGYYTRWVANLTESSDQVVTATICTLGAIDTNLKNIPPPYMRMLTLTYQREGSPPPTNQRGGGRAPFESVFGDWIATGYKSVNSDRPLELAPCLSDQAPIDNGPVSSPGWPVRETG